MERTLLRQQALDWLRADLTAWQNLLEKSREKTAPIVRQKLQHWLKDDDFNGVRGPDALARLPQAEREAWQQLWADVEMTLAKTPEGKSVPSTVPLGKGKE